MKNSNQKAKSRPDANPTSKPASRMAKIGIQSDINDIIEALKADHDVLRELGKVLKSEKASDTEKKEAYQNFSILLKSHAKSEEKAVYERCLDVKELIPEAGEGFVEHQVADTLMKNIACTHNKDQWNAMVKVLAEVVEHHADEEEKELLPDLEKHFKKNEQAGMSQEFVSLRVQSQKIVTQDNAGVLAGV